MRNIKLTLQYDGTDFSGFELQPEKRTIRGEIESALLKVFKSRLKIISSSRTDARAHALGLVVNFKVKTSIPTSKIATALNSCLPMDMRVAKAEEVDESFNARFDAKSKEYEYLIYNGEILPPHLGNLVRHVKPKLNLALMRKAAKILVGKHDFSSFCAAGGDNKNFVRTLYKVAIRERNISIWQVARDKRSRVISCKFVGNSFLYKMVRNMVGTLVDVGMGKRTVSDVKRILLAKDRRKAGRTAPPQGLCLVKVHNDVS